MRLDIFRSNKTISNGQLPTQDDSPNKTPTKKINEEADRKAFLSYSQQSGLPPSEEWPNDSSVLVVASHRSKEVMYETPPFGTSGGGKSCSSLCLLPMNGCAVPFNGPHFEGKLVSRVRDDAITCRNEGNLLSNR